MEVPPGVEFKAQCLKVFCYHDNKSAILLFYSIFRKTPEVSSKLYFVEICQVSEKLWLFNHKRADFWLPDFGFKRSLLSLLKFKWLTEEFLSSGSILKLPLLLIQSECKIRNFRRTPVSVRVLLSDWMPTLSF